MKTTLLVSVLALALSGTAAFADDTAKKHPVHTKHKHSHKKNCGHKAEKHGDHQDYDHDGHKHKKHGGHYDECAADGDAHEE